MLEYILSLAGALDESFIRRLAPMSTTEVSNQVSGVCLVQIAVYEIDLASVIEQYIGAIDELTNWRGVCKKQKRAKALRSSQVSKEFLKDRTRPGIKKALNCFESCSIEDELEFYENKLTDIIKYRRNLIDEVKKASDYLASLAYDQYSEIYRGIEYFERIDELINLADRKVIPGLRSIIRVLKDIDKKDTKRVSKIKSSNYKDKKYGRRIQKRPDQPYKRNRDIARVNKSAGRYAFM